MKIPERDGAQSHRDDESGYSQGEPKQNPFEGVQV